MAMPKDLVLVRHGQSVGNLATKRSKEDDGSLVKKTRHIHNSQFRLSPEGRQQAAMAGDWLRQQFSEGFYRHYVSAFVRARETAALLRLPDARWMEHLWLVEREWGAMASMTPSDRKKRYRAELRRRKRDGLMWAPPGGESILQAAMRVQRFIDTLARECTDRSVVVVCHGDIMWAFRVALERMSMECFRELDESEDPHHRIHNCQVLHYSRTDPENGALAGHLDWMRSVCTSDPRLSSNDWTQIVRLTYSNEELLARVSAYPTFLD